MLNVFANMTDLITVTFWFVFEVCFFLKTACCLSLGGNEDEPYFTVTSKYALMSILALVLKVDVYMILLTAKRHFTLLTLSTWYTPCLSSALCCGRETCKIKMYCYKQSTKTINLCWHLFEDYDLNQVFREVKSLDDILIGLYWNINILNIFLCRTNVQYL